MSVNIRIRKRIYSIADNSNSNINTSGVVRRWVLEVQTECDVK